MFQTLSGCVESVEDHGYLVDIGVSGTKAFLPKKSTASKQGRESCANTATLHLIHVHKLFIIV